MGGGGEQEPARDGHHAQSTDGASPGAELPGPRLARPGGRAAGTADACSRPGDNSFFAPSRRDRRLGHPAKGGPCNIDRCSNSFLFRPDVSEGG